MSISDIKRRARQAIHGTFGEPCTYTAPDGAVFPSAEQSAAGLSLTVRFGSKLRVFSPETDAATILEHVERVIFNQDQLDALDLVPDHAGQLVIPGYELVLDLDQEMDPDGPLNRYWTVTRGRIEP